MTVNAISSISRYFKRVFGLDAEHPKKEQWRILVGLRNVGTWVRERFLAALRYILLISAVTATISRLFVKVYEILLAGVGLELGGDFAASFLDSLAVFENVALFTGGADPGFVVSSANPELAREVLSGAILVERLIGVLVNAIATSSIVAVALRSINPLWISPRVVLDTSEPGKERLTFRYWIRYPKGRWMFDVTCLVRFQSDMADRSIDRAMDIDSRHEEHHVTRRGVCEVNLGFDDVTQDSKGESVGSARKHALALMVLARYAEAGHTYRVRFGAYEEIVRFTKALKERYSEYHILFRVAGTTTNSRKVLLEKKYKVDDIPFGFIFKTPEEVIGIVDDARPWRKLYKYNYSNVWSVEKCDRSKRPIDYDITGVDSSVGARRCIKLIDDGSPLVFDDGRAVSATAKIWSDRGMNKYIEAKLIFDVMSQVHETLNNKDTYVIIDEEGIRRKLEEDTFAFLTWDTTVEVAKEERKLGMKGKLVGFAMFQVPKARKKDNFGYVLGLSEGEAKKVMMVDSVAVLPAYRGQGLQKRLIALGEERGIRKGCKIFIATADPRNRHSIDNFIQAGYRRTKIVRAYGGKPREILVKRYWDSFFRDTSEERTR